MIDVGGESGVTYTDVSGDDVEARARRAARRAAGRRGRDGLGRHVEGAASPQRALDAGAHIINDISGLADPADRGALRGAAARRSS